MIRDDVKNRLIFYDDDDIRDWCVLPCFELIEDNDGRQYYDWNFTDDYNDAIAGGAQLLVRDPDSRILKDQLIGYRGCTKPFAISYDFDNKMEEVMNACKKRAKEEKNKLKAKIEKHIEA